MGQTFKAICPATRELHVFELVSENNRMAGWCTKCRSVWPLAELTDGKADEPGDRKKRKRRPTKT